MKRQRLLLQVFTACGDGAAVVVGVWMAYIIRFSPLFTEYVPIVTALPPLSWYVRLAVVFAGLTVVFISTGKAYSLPQQSFFDEAWRVAIRFFMAYLLMLAGMFFYRRVSFSRITMVMVFVFSGAALLICRTGMRKLREYLYRHGFGNRRAAIVGEGRQAQAILKHLSDHPHFGYQVVGFLSDSPVQQSSLMPTATALLGRISEAGDTVKAHRIDTFIISPTAEERDILPRLVKSCYGINVDFLYLPDIQPANGRPKRILQVGGTPLWTLRDNPFVGWHGVAKRAFDLTLSSLLLIASLPVMLAAAAAVKLNSRGPVFYKQPRVGMDGKEFNCLKFRSMRIDAEKDSGAVWAKANDPRVTSAGRFLRRWSLDELPQLFNVWKGDMSLVGPRPERPEFVRQFELRIDGYQERHRVRAGLTGWAQVNGLRGDTPISERTAYDRYYVENWSLMFDLKILLMTAHAVLKGDNAY